MGVMDNGRSWTCTAYAYDIQFGNPAQNNSVTWKLAGTYPNTKIKGWKLTDTMSQNGDVAFGSTGSKAISLELLDLADKDFGTGAILGVVLGGAANGSWYFFVDNVEWTTNFGTTTTYSASVTAYDAMYYASNKISSVSLPTYYTNMINNGKASVDSCCEIAQYCIRHGRYDLIRTRAQELYTKTGEAKYDTYANMLDSAHDDTWTAGTKTMDDVVSNSVGKVNITPLSGYGSVNITLDKTVTGRGLLGRMAAMAGKRAYCDNGTIGNIGKIVFDNLLGSNYNSNTPVATKDVYDNGFVAEGKKNFRYFVSGTTNAPATYGKKTSNGYSTMAISCPDMDSSRLAHLSSSVASTEYELGKVKFRGDPALKAGMKVKFPDAGGTAHNTIATKVVSNYDGGFYQTVYSEGKSDSDIEFETNQAAEKATSTVENADSDAGGGGTPTLIYYSESTSPDKATIDVDGITVEVDNSGTELQAQNYHLTLDKTGGYSLTNGGNEFMTLNSTAQMMPGCCYQETAKINFGDAAWSGGSWTHKTNVAAHGNFGARNIGTNNLVASDVYATSRFGFANYNSGNLENPATKCSFRFSDGDGYTPAGVYLYAGYDITFDFAQADHTTTIKANALETRTLNYTEIFGNSVHATSLIDNGIVGYPGNNRISFGGGHATYAGSVFMNFQNDKIVFTQRDYVTDPDDGHFISMTTTTITMNLTATNINDLFTFSQS